MQKRRFFGNGAPRSEGSSIAEKGRRWGLFVPISWDAGRATQTKPRESRKQSGVGTPFPKRQNGGKEKSEKGNAAPL